MTQNTPHVMVMIPTYNEQENLELLVQQILALPLQVQITIVDDDSPDGTGELADRLAEQDPRVHVCHRRGVRGRASAGIAGFKAALQNPDINLIVEMDADFSHDPADLPRLVEKAAQYDVVIGSRYIPGGQAINCTLKNVAFSRIINFVNRMLFGLPVHDSSGGYKCYRRRVLETINLDNYLSREYSVGIETLIKCKSHGFSLAEVPIVFRNRTRGKSKANFHVLVEYPLTLILLEFKSLQGQIR
ncbi:MAG: polyprenol monophosphomannose synthase [Anaerolineae bacterium]